MSYKDVMALRPRLFWFLVNQIERLRAEDALRQIEIKLALESAEAYEKTKERLINQVGQIYVWEPEAPVQQKIDAVDTTEEGLDPEFDREGLRALKARIAAGR